MCVDNDFIVLQHLHGSNVFTTVLLLIFTISVSSCARSLLSVV